MELAPEGSLLWQATHNDVEDANLTHYRKWLAENRDLQLNDYPELWRWSVDYIEQFWASLWDYFGLCYSKPAGHRRAKKLTKILQRALGTEDPKRLE